MSKIFSYGILGRVHFALRRHSTSASSTSSILRIVESVAIVIIMIIEADSEKISSIKLAFIGSSSVHFVLVVLQFFFSGEHKDLQFEAFGLSTEEVAGLVVLLQHGQVSVDHVGLVLSAGVALVVLLFHVQLESLQIVESLVAKLVKI